MDVEIVQRAKTGNSHALEEIYNDTRQMVYFTALGIVRNEDDAEDVVQDTYIKVFQNIARLQDEKAFINWLKMIVVNVSKNNLKKRKPMLFQNNEEEDAVLGSIEEVGENFLPQEYVDQAEKREIIKSMIENLPDAQRTAVMLYYFDELPLSEVSKIMETTEGTTKSRLNYARKQIRAKVDEQERQGNKLYAGVPMLTRILHMVSRNYDLPAETAKYILANSLQEANIAAGTAASSAAAGSEAAGQAAIADQASAALESSATGTATKASVAKGILAKIAGMSARTKLIALIAAGVVVVGSGTGAALAVKHHNDAVQAAIVLQQKQKAESEAKAKAASEAAAKKKAEEEAAASSQQEGQQNSELMAQLCTEGWAYQGNGFAVQEGAYFYPDGTCKFVCDKKVIEDGLTIGEAPWQREEYDGTFQTIGGNDISVSLKYSKEQVADSSKDCSGIYTVGWNWNDPTMEEMVKTEEGPNVSPMTLTLKSLISGDMPFEAKKVGEVYDFYIVSQSDSTTSSESTSSTAPSSSSQTTSSGTEKMSTGYAIDYLGLTLQQLSDRLGKDYYSPGNYSGGAVIAYHDNRTPFQFIFPVIPPEASTKITVVVVKKDDPIDSQLKGGMTYQQLKSVFGSSVGTPEENVVVGGWGIAVEKEKYFVNYYWSDQAGTDPTSTFVDLKQ